MIAGVFRSVNERSQPFSRGELTQEWAAVRSLAANLSEDAQETVPSTWYERLLEDDDE